VLGDMLELGTESQSLHASLAQPLIDADTDLVFTLGDEMRALDDALPAARRGGHASNVTELAGLVKQRLHNGDVVTVKGSHGSKVYELVAALLAAPSAKSGSATSKAGA
jgi:UDP-N-acetylmuramoyl-tripeptide--D-alanyl-D-alanine ligase